MDHDMQHHPIDDILRSQYSAKKRANGKQVPGESRECGFKINDSLSWKNYFSEPLPPPVLSQYSPKRDPNLNHEKSPLDQTLEKHQTLFLNVDSP